MKKVLLTFTLLGLYGCQSGGIGMPESPAWFATATQEQQIAYFSKQCSAYGFKPGTNEMAQCLMMERGSSRSGARARAAMASQSIAASQPRPVTTNCNRFGNSVNCTSW